MSFSHPKKALVVATEGWPLAARIWIALSNAGFKVSAVSPPGGLTRKVRAIERHYTYWPCSGAMPIKRAIADWSPDLLVPADDQATINLHYLHLFALSRGNEENSLTRLIEKSLGDPTNFSTVREKSKFILCAQALGVRCPPTKALSEVRVTEPDLSTFDFPILVKADGTHGGAGVRRAKSLDDVRDAVKYLSRRQSRKRLSIFSRQCAPSLDKQTFSPRTICLQQYIHGRSANRALVCLHGKVLAGINVEVIESQTEFGPASVVRLVEQPEMTAAAAKLVEHFKLSGFIGFDFIIDATGQPWLLEMNPRATPSSYMSTTNGIDLAATIYLQMTGKKIRMSAAPEASNEIVVLFPQELIRAPQSPYLASDSSHYHVDIPWHEPQLVRACISYAMERGARKHLRRKLGIGFLH